MTSFNFKPYRSEKINGLTQSSDRKTKKQDKAGKFTIEVLLLYHKLLIDHCEKSFSNSAADKSHTSQNSFRTCGIFGEF